MLLTSPGYLLGKEIKTDIRKIMLPKKPSIPLEMIAGVTMILLSVMFSITGCVEFYHF